MLLLGIDLGGRTTGKTAAALIDTETGAVTIYDTRLLADITNKTDANFIGWIESLKPDITGIDAPLSLPDFSGGDYLFRPVDRIAGGMSPMRLGELTARAIHIKGKLGMPVFEVYPKSILKLHGLPAVKYKNDPELLQNAVNLFRNKYPLEIPGFELNGDNVDALAAALVLYHYYTGNYIEYGDNEARFILPV